jgi:hypothetical protein
MSASAAWAQDLETGDESVPTSDDGIVPVYYEGNPTCEDLGYAHGYKLQDDGGDFDGGTGTFYFPDGSGNSIWIDSDGVYVDWTSTFGIDAVIVKGGPNANSYVYDTNGAEGYEDGGLAPPDNPHNDVGPYGLSHVDFCYDYEVNVEKDATTDFDRDWDWGIDKSSDVTDLKLSKGQTYDMVQYDVSVWQAGHTDSNWSVHGTITISNPDPDYSANLQSVSDVVSGDIGAAVDCGVDFPYTLGAGETLVCDYWTALPDGECRVNTATVEVCDGSMVGGGSGTADVNFGEPTNETDACINVWDDQYGDLGTVCEDSSFQYCINVGPYDTCGDYTFTNTASYDSCDSDETGSDSWDVNVSIPCGCSCTLTQGYWKTHSEYGPAPYDDAWALLSDGADTLFFKSGISWYDQFWTAPAGDFYFNLAHQYAAAKLNLLNGSMAPSAVKMAMKQAETLFNAQGSGDTTLTSAEKKTAGRLMTTLANYNEGVTGPGHCDE